MLKIQASYEFGETPLTDPRSVVSSVLFHGLLVLLVGWLAVFSAAVPVAEPSSRPMRGELEPVDNRADRPQVPGEGGGSPGRSEASTSSR